MLTYLPQTDRNNAAWLEKAATLPIKEFKHEVETALERKAGLKEGTIQDVFRCAAQACVREAVRSGAQDSAFTHHRH